MVVYFSKEEFNALMDSSVMSLDVCALLIHNWLVSVAVLIAVVVLRRRASSVIP